MKDKITDKHSDEFLNENVSKTSIALLLFSTSESLIKTLSARITQDNEFDLEIGTLSTKTPDKALSLLSCHKIDIIIVDLTTAEDIGLALIKDSRQHCFEQPIIVISPPNCLELIKKAFTYGAQEYFFDEGPCSGSHLTRIIKLTLERRELFNQMQERTREQFHEVINRCVENMIILNADGVVLYLNDSARTLLTDDENSFVNKVLDFSVFHADQGDGAKPTLLSLKTIALLNQTSSSIDLELRLPDVRKTMVCRVSDIFWKNQKAYLLALHDITDIKKVASLKAELVEKNRLDKMKNELIGVISHELRTPLTIIKSAIENLKDGILGNLSDKQQKIIETTDRNVNRLARMINNLLDMSRLESGRVRINKHKIRVDHIITDVATSFKEHTIKKNLVINTLIPNDLPFVYADPDLFTQVLINIITNALRYSKSQVTITAEVIPGETLFHHDKPYTTNGAVQISIKDDGTGISQDNLEVVFDKFHQIDRQVGGSGYKGTGLGLAICRQIIDLHGGKIWADSQLGSGATFHFTLPLYDVHDDFLDALDRIIKKAETADSHVTVIILGLANLSEIQALCTEKDVAWLFNDMSREIRNKALRATDYFHFRRDRQEFILVFADTEASTAQTIIRRIHNLTKDCFCPGKKGKIYVTLKSGFAVFPDDANNPRDLIHCALQGMK